MKKRLSDMTLEELEIYMSAVEVDSFADDITTLWEDFQYYKLLAEARRCQLAGLNGNTAAMGQANRIMEDLNAFDRQLIDADLLHKRIDVIGNIISETRQYTKNMSYLEMLLQ